MEKENNPLLLPAAIIMAGVIIALGIVYQPQSSVRVVKEAPLKEKFELPVIWNNLGKLEITRENAGLLLNLFWALGLANKNEILEKGEMANPKYGGVGNFASTGGWTIAQGNAMEWKDMDPQEILGVNYSSAQGYAKIAAEITQPQQQRGGSGCGV